MNLDLQKFTDHMSMHFGEEYWNKLNEYIKDSNALIAGGAVLAAYSNDDVNDLDIYIHASKAVDFVNNLTNDGTYEVAFEGNYLRPSYDQSIYRKNNILARFSFNTVITRKFPVIDVMIIPDEIPLLSVVTNFDLSFCEIWYDGYYVKAVDAEGVLTKTGILKKDYTDKLLLDLNRFTIKRLKKYIKKGYIISYDSEKPINTFEKETKSILSPEEWVVHKLYNWIIFSIRTNNRIDSLKILCKYPLPKYTLREFRRILPDLIRKTIPPSFLIGIKNVKDIYMKILFSAGARNYPPEFFKHVENTLNITMEDIDEYETRHVEASFIGTNNYDRRGRHIYHGGGYGPTQTDIDAFEFDEADDIDENTIDIALDIQDYLNEMNTLLFINKDTDLDYDIISYSKDDIEDIVFNKNNWFYECTGPLDDESNKPIDVYGDTPYVKIPIGSDYGYIPLIQLKKLLQSYDKIYYVYKDYFMSHTIDYLGSWWGGYPDTTSTNHCQNGSNIQSLTLKVCSNPEKCFKSLSNKTRESRILFSEE